MSGLQTKQWIGAGLGLAALLAAPFASAQTADYKLSTGDTLEISAVGVPSMRQRATIGPDGTLSLPFVGDVKAGGLTLPEVRSQVREVISTKDVRLVTNEGREVRTVIAPEEVSLEVVEYRPIFVQGDVARGGQQPFRPGLTVRQAVAVAGGYDINRIRVGNPFMEQPELQSQYEALRTELVKEQTRMQAAQAELDGKDEINRAELLGANADNALYARVAELEAQQLSLRIADQQKERAFLESALRQTDAKIAALRRLAASPRGLEANVQAAQARIDREEIARKLQALDDRRKIELLRAMQEAQVKIADLRGRVQSVGEKLLYTGSIKPQMNRSRGDKVSVVIHRTGPNGLEQVEGSEDMALLPGDSVEVRLQLDQEAPRQP